MEISVLGTGRMGAPIAESLSQGGFEVVAWNRTIERARSLAAQGVRVEGDLLKAIRAAGAIFVSLQDGDAVEEVLLRDEPVRKALAGRRILTQTMMRTSRAKGLEAEFRSIGALHSEVSTVGAPMLVPPREIHSIFAGSEAEFEVWRPALSTFSSQVDRAGPVGHASSIECAMLLATSMLISSALLPMALLKREGIPTEIVEELLRSSPIYKVPGIEWMLPAISNRNYDFVVFSVSQGLNHANEVIKHLEEQEYPTQMMAGFRAYIEAAQRMGMGEKDFTAVFEAMLEDRDRGRQ